MESNISIKTAVTQRAKSKTYQVATLLSVLTYIESNQHIIIPLLPVSLQPLAPLLWGAAMIVMREVTKEPLSVK